MGRIRWTGYAALALAVGAIFHALDLVARGIQAGNIPVANFAESLSFLAWLVALIALVLIVRLADGDHRRRHRPDRHRRVTGRAA